MQAVLVIEELPERSLEAGAAFYADHLQSARTLLDDGATTSLVIALPAAGPDHDDWRRTLARDLARAAAPKRANVVGGGDGRAKNDMMEYLRDAPGVTGQYLAAHE